MVNARVIISTTGDKETPFNVCTLVIDGKDVHATNAADPFSALQLMTQWLAEQYGELFQLVAEGGGSSPGL